MYTGSNPSALRSRKWLHDALLQLLKIKKYHQISIKDICTQADLSRQTFYQIFHSKDEIMEYHFSILFAEFIKCCEQYQDITIYNISHCFFDFFYTHQEFIKILIENNLTSLLEFQFEYYLQKIEFFRRYEAGEENTDYTVSFISGALTQMLIHWFQKDFDLNVEQISRITQHTLTGMVFQNKL